MAVEGLDVLQVHIQEAGYIGTEAVVHDLQFTVRSGEWLGLIGPNGSGKSTTIKSILGLLQHCKGTIRFPGERGTYAYIPEQPILYEELTLWEHLELAAAVYELEPQTFRQRANELLIQFRMDELCHHLPGSFSKGMQQKAMLILGFLNRPDVYLVDEPFIGLDPRAIKDLLHLMEAERKRGAGILMSTHVLDTAERICDQFLLLSSGSKVAQGTLNEIREQCNMPEASLFDCFHFLV